MRSLILVLLLLPGLAYSQCQEVVTVEVLREDGSTIQVRQTLSHFLDESGEFLDGFEGVCLTDPPPVDECVDGLNNDGDYYTDSEDPQCFDGVGPESPIDPAPECDNGLDDDNDGLTDAIEEGAACDDGTELPVFTLPECADGIDNDLDGLIDSAEEGPACDDGTELPVFAPDECADGIDNDGDQYLDALDPECFDGNGPEAPFNSQPSNDPPTDDAVVAFESNTQFSGSCVSENSFGLHLDDLNLDGQQDIVTFDHGEPGQPVLFHCLWANNNGTFVLDPSGTSALTDIGNSACTWSAQITDFTGDGKPDIWCRGSESGSDFYENTTATVGGPATFDHTHGWLGEPGGSNVGGYKDDYMFFSDGPGLGLQRINDEGVIRRVSDGVETLDTGLIEPDVFDMDGDGLADLWSPESKRVLKNLGGSFQEVTYDPDLDLCYWIGAAQHVDFDKDGDLDLMCLVYNDPSTTSDLVALRNDGGFQWSPVAVSHINADGNPSSLNFAYSNYRRNSLTKGTTTVTDFDNNGWVDIGLVNIGGAFQVYRQIGPAAFQSVDVGDVKTDPMRYRTKVASGDVNNDGKQDVIAALVDDTQTTARVLTNITPTSNRSVVIKLDGAAPNTSGHGALIQALDASGAIISSNYVDNSRRRTTNNYRHLGVALAQTVTIRVVWPGGSVSTYADIATNARYVLSAGGITAL